MDSKNIDFLSPLWAETLNQLRHDIYHLADYVTLESRRNQGIPEAIVIADGDKIFFVPYLLRQCDDICDQDSADLFDVVSPYGYPGILLSEAAASTPGFPDAAMAEFKRVLSVKGVCSAFLRLHPILNHNINELFNPNPFTFNGETISIDLTLPESEIWSHTRKDHRNKINKCKRAGMTARMVPFKDYIQEFIEVYQETMDRVGASGFYYFNYDYFVGLLEILGEQLHLCIVELDNQIISAGIYTECCGIVQAVLGGTKTQFFKQSPSVLETHFVRLWAKERGNEFLHLGGGVGGAKDSLYNFKAGFSKQRYNFLTLRLITDEEKYRYLVDLRAKALNTESEKLLQSKFFPAYRCTH